MKEEKQSKMVSWIFRISVVCIAGAVLSPIFFYFWYKRYDDFQGIPPLGPVGDFLGGTTVTFFTAASVCLLIATYLMQREELKASVEQSKLAREETQFANETMRRQQFETTFFNMLQLHHQIVDGIKVELFRERDDEVYEETCVGREALSELGYICKRFIAVVSDNEYSHNTPKIFIDNFFKHSTIEQEKLNKGYQYFQAKYGNHTGHYMRNNYRIIKFIVENVADNEEERQEIKEKTGRDTIIGDKRFYFGTLRAQWSDAEFELILINSLYEKNHKFKKLIKQYDVLDIKETDKEILKNEPEGSFVLKKSMTAFTACKSLIEND